MGFRYQPFNLVVRDTAGNAVAGALVSVTNATTGTLASLYSGDNLGGSPVSNPGVCDASGRFKFFAGDLKAAYNITASDGSVFYENADTVENHRTTGEHAAGTITAEQLAFDPSPNFDLATHAAREANTHGLGGTEHFVHTKAGSAAGATDDPTLGDVTVDSLSIAAGGTFLNTFVVSDPEAELAAAIAAATAGDTIFIANGTHTYATDTTYNLTKSIHIRGLGRPKLQNVSFRITHTSFVGSLRDLHINGGRDDGIAPPIFIEDCFSLTLSNIRVDASPIEGILIDEATTADRITMIDVESVENSREGLKIAALTSALTCIGCRFLSNDQASGGYWNARLDGAGAGGYAFDACEFRGEKGVYITVPNSRFTNCYFNDAGSGTSTSAQLTSTALNCFLPQYGNRITGTVTDGSGNRIIADRKADYVSSIVTVDNTSLGNSAEYFLLGNFTHNLNTRNLRATLLASDSATFAGNVWDATPSIANFNGGTEAPGGGPSILFDTVNTAKVFWCVNGVRNGTSPNVTAAKDYLVHGVLGTPVDNADLDDYDFTDGATAFALKTFYVRLYLERLF